MKLRWATLGTVGLGFAQVAGCQQILGFEDHTIVDGSAGSSAGSAGKPSGGSAGRATGGASSGSSGKGGTGASAGSGNAGGNGASAGDVSSGGSGGASMGSGGDAGDTGSGGSAGDVSSGGSSGDGAGGSSGKGGSGGKGGSSGRGGTGGTGGDGGGGGSGNSGTGGTGGTGGDGGTGGSGGTGGMSGSAGAGMAGSGSTVPDPPPIVGGVTGWATRYWNCCKPTCGLEVSITEGQPAWSCNASDTTLPTFTQPDGCAGGTAYLCSAYAPWSVSPTLSYGFSAGPGAANCGECYQIELAGTTTHGTATANQAMLSGKKMIVQVLNSADLPNDQLDLLIPGGGIGQFSACANQWGTSELGAQYGGWLTECSNDTACVRTKCENAFSDLPDFLDGCIWFLDWFHGANNPDLVYKRIACPAALTERSGLSDPD